MNECSFLNSFVIDGSPTDIDDFLENLPKVALKAVIGIVRPAWKNMKYWLSCKEGAPPIESFRGKLRPLTLGRSLNSISNDFLFLEIIRIKKSYRWQKYSWLLSDISILRKEALPGRFDECMNILLDRSSEE